MTPDEVEISKVIEVLQACEPISIEGQPETVNDFKQAIQSALTILQDYQKLRKRVKELTTCFCGRKLGIGKCPICDNDD